MFWLLSVSVDLTFGAKAAIDFLNHHFANLQTKEERKAPTNPLTQETQSHLLTLTDLVEYDCRQRLLSKRDF